MNTRLVAANWALFFLAVASGTTPALSQQSLPQSQQAQQPGSPSVPISARPRAMPRPGCSCKCRSPTSRPAHR
jgi:hypothetical protein